MTRQPVTVVSLLVAGVLAFGAPAAEAQLVDEVREKLRGERDLRRLEVTVTGSEALLSGELKNFWLKHQAIERALEVDGIETVASEIVIPPAESDQELAEKVAEEVQDYPYYTLFDYLDGLVNNGVVTLMGRVTPDRDKASEIFERVAKIDGTQDVRNEIRSLTPSNADRNLRRAIAQQIFRSPDFERFAIDRNPPFRVVVERSVVTLVGWVQGEIERRQMEQIARQTQGVLRVINELQTFQ